MADVESSRAEQWGYCQRELVRSIKVLDHHFVEAVEKHLPPFLFLPKIFGIMEKLANGGVINVPLGVGGKAAEIYLFIWRQSKVRR